MQLPEFVQDFLPWFIAAGVLALLWVIFIIRRQPSRVVAFETETGRVVVGRSAIVELVQTSCDQIKGMKRPRIRIKNKSSGLSLTVSVRITESCRLKDYANLLQEHLERTLTQNLGITKISRVDIMVQSFRSGTLPPLQDSDSSKLPDKKPDTDKAAKPATPQQSEKADRSETSPDKTKEGEPSSRAAVSNQPSADEIEKDDEEHAPETEKKKSKWF